ncbi:hypothetical protein HYS47_03250 [Candidatus Woesearchaeota archaeon]|nr:hypothetical protein [Candidatus Woesearchaeota archaeon]
MCTCDLCRTIARDQHEVDHHPAVKEFVEQFLTPMSGTNRAWMVRGIKQGRQGYELVLERVDILAIH